MNLIKTGYVLSYGAEIYYEVYGNGQPLVFLHGNGENLHYFEKQFSVFAEKFSVIAIDSRGHGKSSFGNSNLSISLMAKDIIEVLKHLDISSANILGFSDGGNVALQIAIKYPIHTKSLVLVGANLHPKGVKSYIQIPIICAYHLCSWLSKFDNKAKIRVQILSLMVNEPNFAPQQLSNINVPTLVIAGEKDMIRTEHTELIAGSISNSRLCIIPKGDHFIANKMSEIFNQEVLCFLSQNI